MYTMRMSKIFDGVKKSFVKYNYTREKGTRSSKREIEKIKIKFNSFDEALNFAKSNNISIEKVNDLESLNKTIEIILQLRKSLRPLEPDSILKYYLNNTEAKIVPIESSQNREGTAVHIVNDGHADMYLDENRLATITTDISKQEVITLAVTKNRMGKERFLYRLKMDEKHSTIMILDWIDGKLEMVTAYAPKNKAAKKNIKRYCIIYDNDV